ncbi:hypothetical protein [Brevundimonas sp.]|uniref:hypothetical protein n=1 Tax=Brevundimonas sp. TaxID=1871086 RepID=UPI0025CDA6D0|nr:hypothetical protein [Brevundimonas sp.]
MEKTEILKIVADDLFATEKAVDDAIAQATDMIATMIQARRDANLSAVVGAEAQAKMIEAVAALGAARSAVVASHAEMAKVQRLVGLGHLAVGPTDKPDEGTGDGGGGRGVTARRALRVAASQ